MTLLVLVVLVALIALVTLINLVALVALVSPVALLAVLSCSSFSLSNPSNSIIEQFYYLAIASTELCELVFSYADCSSLCTARSLGRSAEFRYWRSFEASELVDVSVEFYHCC